MTATAEPCKLLYDIQYKVDGSGDRLSFSHATMPTLKATKFEVDRETHVARVRMDRPNKLNALNVDLYDDLNRAIEYVEKDDDIKVMVLSGEGRAFSTGQDLSEVGKLYDWPDDPEERRPSQRKRIVTDHYWMQAYVRLFYCLKATIAQVQGPTLAGGFDLAMACDMIVSADNATFGHPGQRLVGPAFDPNPVLWLWRLGPGLAKSLMLTGETIGPEKLLDNGVIASVWPEEELEAETQKVANKIARMPADGIVLGKAAWNLSADAMGVGIGHRLGGPWHSYATNLRFEPDEFNFFKERSKQGARDAFHARDEHFESE